LFLAGRKVLTSKIRFVPLLFIAATVIMFAAHCLAQQPTFRNAPASASAMKDPYTGNAAATAEGKKLYAQNCASCHGNNLQGMGPAPALDSASIHKAKSGELFWFVTNGKPDSGMPAWKGLPTNQRWQIVSFLQSNKGTKQAAK
jgi:mono/diheme cytochrome c family protein